MSSEQHWLTPRNQLPLCHQRAAAAAAMALMSDFYDIEIQRAQALLFER